MFLKHTNTYPQNFEKLRQYSKFDNALLTFSSYEQGDFDQLYWANQLRFKEKIIRVLLNTQNITNTFFITASQS